MKYYSGNSIGGKVIDLKPSHIMVAYLGADWKRFLPEIENVARLIVQPNPPTNPRAIEEIIKIIGWDKIQFVDNLHTKVYINLDEKNGNGKAIVGSPNLTANGLGGSGLYEAAVQFDFIENQDGKPHEVVASFNEVWKTACDKYNSEESKKTRLEKLKKDSIKYWEITPFIRNNNARNILEYGNEWDSSFWPVSWCECRDIGYEGEAQELNNRDLIRGSCLVSNEDQIVRSNLQDRWVLYWRVTKRNKPHMTAIIKWIRVHYAYENGCDENEAPYRGILIQDSRKSIEEPPFALDKYTQEAIKNILAKEKYKVFCEEPDDETGWKTQQVNDLMSEWLADVIEEYNRLKLNN